jgi:hypothetical protein
LPRPGDRIGDARGLAIPEQRSAVVGEGDAGEPAVLGGRFGCARVRREADVDGVADERERPPVAGQGDDMLLAVPVLGDNDASAVGDTVMLSGPS